jgi:hypothetical protein
LKGKQRIPLIVSTGKLAAATLAKLRGALGKLALWKNWHSGKTGALAKLTGSLTKQLALWQNSWRSGKLAKLTSTLANWRSGETDNLAKL